MAVSFAMQYINQCPWLRWTMVMQLSDWSDISPSELELRLREDEKWFGIDWVGLFDFDQRPCQLHFGGCAGQLVFHGTKDVQGILETRVVRPGVNQLKHANGIHYTDVLNWRPWSYCIPIQIGLAFWYVVVVLRPSCGKRADRRRWHFTPTSCHTKVEIVKLILKPLAANADLIPASLAHAAFIGLRSRKRPRRHTDILSDDRIKKIRRKD